MNRKKDVDELRAVHAAMNTSRRASATRKSPAAASAASDRTASDLFPRPAESRVVMTLGDIYQMALLHYETLCPERKALATVAGIIGISEKKLYRATVNESVLDVNEEARLFVTTLYPQAYDMKKYLLFPQITHQQPIQEGVPQ